MGKRLTEFWNLLTNYWYKNTKGEYKKISAALGTMFGLIIFAMAYQLTVYYMGGAPDWNTCMVEVIAAVKFFTILFLYIFFGTNKQNGEKEKERPEVK